MKNFWHNSSFDQIAIVSMSRHNFQREDLIHLVIFEAKSKICKDVPGAPENSKPIRLGPAMNKGRFCKTIELVDLTDTSVQSE